MAHTGHQGSVILCFLFLSLLLARSRGENFKPELNESNDAMRKKKSLDRQDPNSQITCSNDPIVINITDVNNAAIMYERLLGSKNIRYYLFRVPDSFGAIFMFHQVPLEKENKLTVYVTALNNQLQPVRIISLKKPDLSPLLVQNNVVSVCVDIQHINVSEPVLNISCTAHVLADMPNEIELKSQTESGRESRHVYNCSRIKNIPRGIKCDMVKQCIDGEDETHCPYQTERCNDLIPYKNTSCLKIIFLNHSNYVSFSTVLTAPLVAKQECKRKVHGGVLAAVPDKVSLDLVERMLKASGYSSLAIGLYKYGKQDRFFVNENPLYRFLWQWEGGLIAHDQIEIQIIGARSECAMLTLFPKRSFVPTPCQVYEGLPFPDGFLCQGIITPDDLSNAKINDNLVPRTPKSLGPLDNTKECTDGSLAYTFLPCSDSTMGTRNCWSGKNFPLYKCNDGEDISFTLVCDGLDNCCDYSDEKHCARSNLDHLQDVTLVSALPTPSYFTCVSGQHVPKSYVCNGQLDCMDGSDEEECLECATGTVFCNKLGCIPERHAMYIDGCRQDQTYPFYYSEVLGKSLLELDGWGFSTQRSVKTCPETHIDCKDWMCIPYYLVLNGELDCLDGEDEQFENSICRGLYRCLYSDICLDITHVCDGVYHCPQRDDELYCKLSCPTNCSCEGYSYKCRSLFETTMYPFVRYLEFSGALQQPVGILGHLDKLLYLNSLNLSNCMLQSTDLKKLSLSKALETLDLSFNNLTDFAIDTNRLEVVHRLNLSHNSLNRVVLFDLKLTSLDLSFNKLTNLSRIEVCFHCRLYFLDLSHNRLFRELDDTFSEHFSEVTKVYLVTLKLVNTGITAIGSRAFANLTNLRDLDISGNLIEMFDKDAFWGLSNLLHLRTDWSKLCCEYLHKKTISCSSTLDDISSCNDLLQTDFFRIFLWGISIIAICGNVGVLIYRLNFNTVETSSTYRILVCNLCIADMTTGIYLLIIGSADARYRGAYVSHEFEWRRSALCQAAGFMALASAEASALLICIITVDRIIILKFPYRTSFHLAERSVILMCAVAWTVSVFLAAVPFWPLNDHWNFYSHTSICLPIPILQHPFRGKQFAVGVFIIANFFHFIFIGVGQLVIFKLVRASTAAIGSGPHIRPEDVKIAQRLLLIIFCHFFCWIPIVIMGILISQGIFIYEDVFAWVLVFVFPFNAALNPFLYTLIILLEKRREKREDKRVQRVLANLKDEVKYWRKDKILELVNYIIQTELISTISTETVQQTNMDSQEGNPYESRV